MSRDPRLYLQDIVDAAAEIEEFILGIDFEAFRADKLLLAGTVRNLEIIGEAARRLPAEYRAAMPAVPCEKLIGMRNILAHMYFNVDRTIVWTAATERVPELAAAVRPFRATLG